MKKTVPVVLRRARVNDRVWEWSIRSKKKLRWFCWDLKRSVRVVSSIRSLRLCLGETPFGKCGREPILEILEKKKEYEKKKEWKILCFV